MINPWKKRGFVVSFPRWKSAGSGEGREEKWDEIGRTPGPRVTQAGRVRCWHGSAKRVGRVPRRIMPIPHKRAARASARIDFQGARAAESTQKYRGLSH